MPGKDPEDFARSQNLAARDGAQRAPNAGLDRARLAITQRAAARREGQEGAPSVGWIAPALDETASLQTAQHAGERARMNMQDLCEVARGQLVVLTDQAQHQTLRSGHADGREHPLRRRLEAVRYRPQQLHEAQNVAERALSIG